MCNKHELANILTEDREHIRKVAGNECSAGISRERYARD
jgi:hypothetical protein